LVKKGGLPSNPPYQKKFKLRKEGPFKGNGINSHKERKGSQRNHNPLKKEFRDPCVKELRKFEKKKLVF